MIRLGFKIFVVFTWICGCMPLLARANSPSFDCAKASNTIEKTICSNADLSKLDSNLSQIYRKAQSVADAETSHDIANIQRKWIKNRNEDCSSDGNISLCLGSYYQTRIDDLQKFIDDKHHYVTQVIYENKIQEVFPDDPHDAQAAFGSDLARDKPGKAIVACSMMMDIPITRYEDGRGASCLLKIDQQAPKRYLVCNDTGAGRYGLREEGPHASSFNALAQFTADHCTGG